MRGGEGRYQVSPERQLVVPFDPVDVRGVIGADTAEVALDLHLGTRSQLQLNANVPRAALAADPLSAPLSGRVKLVFDDFERLHWLLQDRVEAAHFDADGEFHLAGRLGEPRLTGRTTLRGKLTEIADLGIDFDPIVVELIGDGSERLAIQGELVSTGKLGVDGQVILDATQGWPADVHLVGRDIQLADKPRMRVWLSPDLRIDYRPDLLSVVGELVVPILSLEPKELPSGAKNVSADVVVVGEAPPPPRKPPMPIAVDLRLTLGDRVRFRGFGLDAKLGGSLRVVQKPDEAAIATGTLRIREGAYTAYGQDLRIRDGRLLFAGTAVDNPGLDIRAIREVDDMVAGVKISGVAKDPELTLFSTPPMNQTDALSLLLTGKPLRGTSSEEQQSLNAAAAGMSAAGGLLANDLRRKLGFEELQFKGGDDIQSSSILLGRYLTPRLYMSYDVGLTGTSEEVKLRYELTKQWAVETASGDETGGDLIYTIELD